MMTIGLYKLCVTYITSLTVNNRSNPSQYCHFFSRMYIGLGKCNTMEKFRTEKEVMLMQKKQNKTKQTLKTTFVWVSFLLSNYIYV